MKNKLAIFCAAILPSLAPCLLRAVAITSLLVGSLPMIAQAGTVESIPVPSGALAVYSVVRTTGWAGNCLRVSRSSDNAQQDIGWNGNVVDWASADTFAAGSTLTVVKWYDQSGNGKDMAPTGATQSPVFTVAAHWNGIRPITFTNLDYLSGLNLCNKTLSYNANNFTAYMIVSPRDSWEGSTLFVGADSTWASGTDEYVVMYHNYSPMLILGEPGSGPVTINVPDPSRIHSVVFSSGAASIVDMDGTQVSVPSATSQPLATFAIGMSQVGGYNYVGDVFFVALYPANHSAATVTTNRSAFVSGFVAPGPFSNKIVYAGSSLVPSWDMALASNLPRHAGFGRASADDGYYSLNALPSWDSIAVAHGGRTLASEAQEMATYESPLYNPTMSANVWITDAPSNDISGTSMNSAAAAQTAMSALYNNYFLPYVGALRAIGYHVVAPTIIPRGGFQLNTGNFMENARLDWNSMLIAGAATNGYTVSDRCSVYPFNGQTFDQTYYYTDYTHCTDAGYALLASCDRQMILAAGVEGGGGVAPPAPTGLTASAGNATVTLSWTTSSGATSYNVYRGTSSGGESTIAIATGMTSTSYTDTGLTNGTAYYYVLKAVNTYGASGNSNEANATPTGGSGSASGVITWSAGQNMIGDTDVKTNGILVDAATFYSSAVSVNGTTFNPLLNGTDGTISISTPNGGVGAYSAAFTSASPSSTNYSNLTSIIGFGYYANGTVTLSNLLAGTAYQIQAWSYCTGIGSNANTTFTGATPVTLNAQVGQYAIGTFTASGTTQSFNYDYNVYGVINAVAVRNIGGSGGNAPAVPTGLTATAGNAQAALSWTASTGATSYNVYRGTSAGNESATAIATGITSTSYTDTGLTNGMAYYYKVTATNSIGASDYSNESSATPSIPTYALTVTNGTGSGSYAAGTVVTVSANAPSSGYQFASWTGDISALVNPAASVTTLTMPSATTAITATYSLTPYTEWSHNYFSAQQQGDLTVSGPAAIPQNDGISNLLKYLFDINPAMPMSAADRAALPEAGMLTANGSTYLTLTYRQNSTQTGLAINVQTSTDLKTWTTVTPDNIVSVGTDPVTHDPLIQVQVEIIAGVSQEYIRLNVVGS